MESNLERLRTHDEYMDKRAKGRNPKLTIAQARKQLPAGWVLQKTPEDEYRVGRRGSPESQRYYTDDLQDAIGTARDMASRDKKANPNEISPAYRVFGYGKPGRIHAGMRVKIAGTNKSGRVVMPSSQPGYWVLNMGGPHGTPKVVHEDNIITRGVSKNPGRQGQRLKAPAPRRWYRCPRCLMTYMRQRAPMCEKCGIKTVKDADWQAKRENPDKSRRQRR